MTGKGLNVDEVYSSYMGNDEIGQLRKLGGSNYVSIKSLSKDMGRPSPITEDENEKVKQAFRAQYREENISFTEREEIIPIKDLFPTQSGVDKEKLKSLTKFYEMKGILSITVEHRNGRHYIRDGHHRTAAAKRLGHDTIAATVFYLDGVSEPKEEPLLTSTV